MTSRFLEDDNPFALQPPSRSSKFDPKQPLMPALRQTRPLARGCFLKTTVHLL